MDGRCWEGLFNSLSHPGIPGMTSCFVPVHTLPPPTDFGSRNNFGKTSDLFNLWQDLWPWPIGYLIRFWSILNGTLTLNFQGQLWNLLYLSQKWSDCHKTKSKHVDWTPGHKCHCGFDLQESWPWLWPWPWIFKVKYGICYISAKNGLMATKRKANILMERKASNVSIRFDLGCDLERQGVKIYLIHAIDSSSLLPEKVAVILTLLVQRLEYSGRTGITRVNLARRELVVTLTEARIFWQN